MKYIRAVLASILVAASGTAHANHSGQGTQIGLFEGIFIFDNDETEPFVMRFDSDHGLSVLSELEPVERESTGIGHWERERNGLFSFGYISYREGSGWLCTGFDDTVPAASCTLVGTGTYSIDQRSGELSGSITITIRERADGGDDYTVGPFPMNAEKRSVRDLMAVHD